MDSFLLRSAVIALWIGASMSVTASELRPLTLHDALRAGLQQHPQLRSFTLRAQSLQGELESAALSPPLTLSAEVENIAGSGAYQQARSAEVTLSLSSVIEPRHQRTARQSVVTARQQALATEAQLFELELLADITRRFIAVVAAQEALQVYQQSHQLWQRRVTDLQRRTDAGSAPLSELLRAQAALLQADTARTEAESAVRIAKSSLGQLWGEPDDVLFVAQGNLFNLDTPVMRDDLLRLLDQHPDLRLLADEKRLRDAELRLARTNSALNLEWRAGIRHLNESDDTALVFGVDVPLSTRKRAAGDVKAAAAQHQLAIQQYDTAVIRLRSQLLQLQEEQQLAIRRVQLLRNEIVPLLARAVRESDEAFSKGRYSYMEVSLAQAELLDARLDLIQSAVKAHYWRTELERLSGAVLSDAAQLHKGTQP